LNPKEQDEMRFVGKKGKRRRTILIQEEDGGSDSGERSALFWG
jgi:hypothetical protein